MYYNYIISAEVSWIRESNCRVPASCDAAIHIGIGPVGW